MMEPGFYAMAEHVLIAVFAAALILLGALKIRTDNRYALLIDSLNSQAYGLIFFDKKGRFVQANKQASAYIPLLEKAGKSFQTVQGFLNYMYDHAVDCDPSLRKAIHKTVEKQDSQNFREAVSWGKNQICLITAEKSSRGGYVFILTDVTDLRRREAETHQAQKLEALGKLAAGVAHDFNNVLSIVDGYSRMIEDEAIKGSKIENYIGRIRAASQRGASLTKRMLTFSSHKIVTEAVVDLYQAVKDQAPLLQPLLGAAIELSFTPPSEAAHIECAPDSVGQILMNLVVNARDAMPDGGRMTIGVDVAEAKHLPSSVRKPEGVKELVVLTVTDTGTGMDRETIHKIFDPFFTTKEQGKGTGLGLSMVYGLVKEMGGTIDVQSLPGAGTTMSIYLPRSHRKADRKIIKPGIGGSDLRLDGYTALVAEDEPELLALVSGMLEGFGMKVLRASNGNEALALQDSFEGQIDLLLTDVVMPELNGVKLAKLFTAVREETKVIFMSGYPASGQMAQAELPRGACFMAKPIVYEELANLIYQRITVQDEAQPHTMNAPYWKVQGAR